jgi:two-component system phosphate regulon sensor histidine kinase PhoR
VEPLAANASIAIETASSGGPLIVKGDREELIQLTQNLAHNAIKYGRRGGHVTLSSSREGGRALLVVADDGIGIAPEHLPRLTERFYRVNAKDSRERGGTGLGLAIVKHILNRHQGELKIESTEGKGSTFTVVLPALSAVQSVTK